MIIKKQLLIITIILILIISFISVDTNSVVSLVSCSYASEDNYGEDSDIHDHDHHNKEVNGYDSGNNVYRGVPPLYYLYWGGLIITIILGMRYLLAYQKGSASREDHTLALIIVVIGLFLYLIDQFPMLKHYHEPSVIGFARFIAKMWLGIIMTFFSFTWMHEN